jgi:hypothetical protein
MGSHSRPAVPLGPRLRVEPLEDGGWRVSVEGLPPSDYESREVACAEAEEYLARQGRGGEVVVSEDETAGPRAA